MYAIVETGGKQHRVEQGDSLNVELIDTEEGGTIELDRVLLAGDGDKVVVGNPVIRDARVVATVNNHGRGEKIIVFRYKNKVRYSNKLGHRQAFTSLTVNSIEVPDLNTTSEQEEKAKENQDGA